MRAGERPLVTGATGFLGSHLAAELLSRGQEPTCLARRHSDTRWLLRRRLPVRRVDLLGPRARLAQVVSGHDVVYHVAGAVRALDYQAFLSVNADATQALLEACLAAARPPRRFVLVSSVGAIGPPPEGQCLREDSPEGLRTDYGRSKREGELRALPHRSEIELVILRPTAIYGPRDQETLPLFRLARRGLLPAFAGPQQVFNLCHAADIARGIALAGHAAVASGTCFQLGAQQECSARQLARIMGQVLERPVRLLPLPRAGLWGAALLSESWARLRQQPAMLNRQKIPELTGSWRLDIDKARQQLGYQPRWELREGLAATLRWYRQRGLV